MKTNIPAPNYKGFRFPPEIISHAVWLYFRFSLSFRDVEELLAQRGIVVTYETVRQWCLKFGQTYANELRRRRPPCGDTWHLDEVFLTIRGQRQYLWRAVDQDGNVLDILVNPTILIAKNATSILVKVSRRFPKKERLALAFHGHREEYQRRGRERKHQNTCCIFRYQNCGIYTFLSWSGISDQDND